MEVISSPAKTRIFVDAGPGTGKTATACARVAYLIEEEGVEPHQILMTSFTNTAIYEIRNRIGSFLKDSEKAAGIRISTLDSFAWAMRAGFRDGDIGFTTYDDNIYSAGMLIELDENAKEFLNTIEHFIVDEAQDITGNRSSLVESVIKGLNAESGVSIFADNAQAIYGFSEEFGSDYYGQTLPERLLQNEENGFKKFLLFDIHRTSEPALKDLFLNGRKSLISHAEKDSRAIYDEVRDLILNTHDEKAGSAYEMLVTKFDAEKINSYDFLLFRRRADALQASQYLGTVPHRLRLSGYPLPIHPWIARCFWDFTEDRMNESAFQAIAQKRLGGTEESIERYWQSLLSEVGVDKNRISVKKLSNLLTRPNLPNIFRAPDYGVSGPIIGTVHASKGREAESVVFFMPHEPNYSKTDDDKVNEKILEEAKILFVGATRTKNTLVVSDIKSIAHFNKMITHYKSQRSFAIKEYGEKKIAVELGKDGDVFAEGLTGTKFFKDESEAIFAQKAIWDRREIAVPLVAESLSSSDWFYQVSLDYSYSDERYDDVLKDRKFNGKVFFLSQNVNQDLFWVGKEIFRQKLRPPSKIKHFYSMGARTHAVASSDAAREVLHEPWRSSGLMLAPMVLGYPVVYLKGYRG